MARKSKAPVRASADRDLLVTQVRLALQELDQLLAKIGPESAPIATKPRRTSRKRLG